MTSVVEPEGAEGWNFMGGRVEKSITRDQFLQKPKQFGGRSQTKFTKGGG